MTAALALVGNPSSIHAEGRRMRDLVERARNEVAGLFGRPREEIVFTSGGTEANALGVLGLAAVVEQRGEPRIVATTPIEHPSLKGAVESLRTRGWRVQYEVAGASLVAIGVVNHELGTIAELPDRTANVLVHVDAVQAAGKLDLSTIDADSIAISAHKIGGPQGIGALAISDDEGLPVLDGGHQERGRRPGTENALGIIGFAAAASAIDLATWPVVAALGERLERGLLAIDSVRINGADRPRIGGTVNAAFARALGESIVVALDLEGVSVSTGAACTSGSVQPSAVLLGLGHSVEEARSAVRFSLGRSTTQAEIDRVLSVVPAIVQRARRHRV
ncbi:MAG: aminotransferase class V-fold PLP-dependent enzyme [Myxococcota bacterium]|nr:aminotransferase class V-fold PLP-dependent enzyme [Myxococcota bacterium]